MIYFIFKNVDLILLSYIKNSC